MKLRPIQEVQFEPGRADFYESRCALWRRSESAFELWADKESRSQTARSLPQLDTKCFSVVSDGLAPNTVQLRPSRDEACQVHEKDFKDLKHPCILRGTFRVSTEFKHSRTREGKIGRLAIYMKT